MNHSRNKKGAWEIDCSNNKDFTKFTIHKHSLIFSLLPIFSLLSNYPSLTAKQLRQKICCNNKPTPFSNENHSLTLLDHSILSLFSPFLSPLCLFLLWKIIAGDTDSGQNQRYFLGEFRTVTTHIKLLKN